MVLDASEMEDKTGAERGEVRSQKQEIRSKKMEKKLSMIDSLNIKKVLIVAPNWIGDAVMSVPAISQIRESFPSARITIIGLPHISELFYESPYVDEIRAYKKDSPFSKGGLAAAGLSLRSEKFDMALLLPNSFRSALLVRLAGIPLRCGYSRDGRGFILNLPVKVDSKIKSLHQAEYYLNLVGNVAENRRVKAVLAFFASLNASTASEAKNVPPIGWGTQRVMKIPLPFKGRDRVGMGLFSDETPMSPRPTKDSEQKEWLHLSQDEIQRGKETLSKDNIPPDSLIIGINPGAAYGSAKRWYPERFAQLGKILSNKYNAKIIVFGGKQELDIAEQIVNISQVSILNMAGKTSVRELMAITKHCRVFITNDSGPMHIAAALGVPVVAIFGSTDPALTTPIGTGHVIIRKDVPCSPCFRRECPTDLKCMDLIHVEDVLGGVEKILGR